MMEQNLPLTGLKVVELATVVAAPSTGRLLADYGADVVKIETPAGDPIRPFGKGHCLPTEPGNTPLFDLLNSGKKCIALDLKRQEGMDVFFRLIESADIFVTNVRYQSLKKMGIDYDSLKERYPRLIYGHFSGFGLKGAQANKAGYDYTGFWMRSGFLLDCLLPDSFPARPIFGFGDLATAMGFLSGLLMAVYARERSGRGTMVSASLLAAGIWCNSPYILNSQPPYNRKYPYERNDPWTPFGDFYQCSDGEWIALFEKNYSLDRFKFAEVFDIPELATDPDLEDMTKMRASGKLKGISQKLERAIARKSSAEWMEILDKNDIPNDLLMHFKDVPQDQQAWDNGCLEEVTYPNGTVAMPTPPIVFSDYGRRPLQINQGIGVDTEEVLRDLGYDEEKIKTILAQYQR